MYFIKKIIKIILPAKIVIFVLRIKTNIYSYFFWRKVKTRIIQIHSRSKNAIIILATPTHGNLGDHAIVFAEKQFFGDMGLSERIIEIPNDIYLNNKGKIGDYITSNDILVIDGGGNLGILWPWEDDKISGIIERYRQNPIIVFPQTCFYDKTIDSKIRLDKNKLIYKSAVKLLITLRDKRSFDFCVKSFSDVNFLAVPDIVLYLKGLKLSKNIDSRSGILLCFRTDLEKTLSVQDIDNIKQCILDKGLKYKETTTVVNYPINSSERNDELQKKFVEFASSKLVVTDRLHGMIFAIITGTPCLAMDNISKKVSGVFNLISGIDSVKICSNASELIDSISLYYNNKVLDQDTNNKDMFLELKELIDKYII